MIRLHYIILALASLTMIAIGISENADYIADDTLAIDVINDIANERGSPHDGKIISGDLNLKQHLLTKKILSKEIKITNSSISGSVDFGGLIFENLVDFNGTTFAREVNFRRAIFKGGLNLTNATFLKDAHFEDATIDDFLHLEGAKYGDKYGHLYLRWSMIKDYIYNDSSYLALINNYEWLAKNDNYNWSKDANHCYIDYRNKKLGFPDIGRYVPKILTASDLYIGISLLVLSLVFFLLSLFFNKYFNPLCRNQSIRLGIIIFLILIPLLVICFIFCTDKTLDFFSFFSSGYGRRPLYTLILSLVIIFLFSLHIRCRYLKAQNLLISFWQSFWLSAAIFLSAPIKDEDQIIDKMGPLAVIERALGWLLLAIFIATLSNVVVIRSGL